MRFVSLRDLRGKSSEIWRRVGAEKDLVVTSNGHPIAILSAVSEDSLEESLAEPSARPEPSKRWSPCSGRQQPRGVTGCRKRRSTRRYGPFAAPARDEDGVGH